MSIKPKYLGISDENLTDGVYVHTLSVEDGYYQTRYGLLWRGMLQRLKLQTAYCDVHNDFENFADFAKTICGMDGYNQKDILENYYHMDKDLKCYKKSKRYSVETIVFIPGHLNTSLKGVVDFLEYAIPCGYSYHKGRGKFRAYCNDGSGKQIHLGYYETAQEAQIAWVKQKIVQIEQSLLREPVHPEVEMLVHTILEDLRRLYE